MRHFKRNIIIAASVIAGAKLLGPDDSPLSQIPENHTGEVSLNCHGETHQILGNLIIADTRKDVEPVTLKLAFKNGEIQRWSAEPQTPPTGENRAALSHIQAQFNLVCPQNASNCEPTKDAKGNTELYRFNYTADDMELGGTGILSPDMSNFAGYQVINGKTYANALTCKMP